MANRRSFRAVPSCNIQGDHARQHEPKSEFSLHVGNETRNPPRRGPTPIKYWGVACAQVAKKPDRKAYSVNRPAEVFDVCNSTLQLFFRRRHQPRRPPAPNQVGAAALSGPSPDSARAAFLTSTCGQPSRIAGYAQAGPLRQCRAVAIFRLLIWVRSAV